MDLERNFYKWYKKVSFDVPQNQIDMRWQGIKQAEDIKEIDEIVGLIRIFLKLSCDAGIKEWFIECFSNIDKGFDDNNEEELAVLAGATLAKLLQGEDGIFIAYSLQVLEPYYDFILKDLCILACDRIRELSIETNRVNSEQEAQIFLNSNWETEIAEEGQFSENAPETLISVIKKMEKNIRILDSKNNNLMNENKIAQEKIEILSWIVGEWSDLLEIPLSEIKDINGAVVLGVELENLVRSYPGPYAAEAFLSKMLNKCKKSVSEVSLTELIDEQGISVKEKIVEKYGSECESRNLPIIAALKASLTVDGKKEWLPAYKKAWKINPDSLKLSLIKWSMLIYQECLVSSY